MRFFVIGVILALAGCTLSDKPSDFAVPAGFAHSSERPERRISASPKIQHIVIAIQENRSFDNFFATFPGADGTSYGRIHTGERIPLQEGALNSPVDPNHDYGSYVVDYQNGKMDGFDLPPISGHSGTYVYQYVNPAQVAPYWNMAKQYALADHMFQTQGSGSFTGHQDLIRGSTQINATESLVDWPSHQPFGCDAPPGTVTSVVTANGQYLSGRGPFPCLQYRTLAYLLDHAGLSWKCYTPPENVETIWNPFDAIGSIRNGPEWSTNMVSPPQQIFTDISNQSLARVSWVIPDFENSDHPATGYDTGPSWVAQIVNAVGESKYWKSTAVIVVWDDWGGWYDHVPPPQLDYGGLGFRVPMIVVSPYVKRGTISHTQYEFSSILRFVEDNWGLGRLPRSNDRRAHSIADIFNFSQKPRSFAPIPAKYSRSFFQRQAPSNKPVDTE